MLAQSFQIRENLSCVTYDWFFTECLDKRVNFAQVAASAVLFWVVCLSLLIQYFNFWGRIVNEQKGLIQTVISGSE